MNFAIEAQVSRNRWIQPRSASPRGCCNGMFSSVARTASSNSRTRLNRLSHVEQGQEEPESIRYGTVRSILQRPIKDVTGPLVVCSRNKIETQKHEEDGDCFATDDSCGTVASSFRTGPLKGVT